MSSAFAPTPNAAPAPRPYVRQTPTVWQALGRGLWQVMERAGQRRAARELHALAQRLEPFDPALARQLRAAAQHDTASTKGPSA